ncbi:MAG: hypothetical protein AB8C40_10480 [Gammaproteobacteria bacterium]
MSVSNKNNFSVKNILIDSINIIWRKRNEFSKALALPVLLIVSIWAINRTLYNEQLELMDWVLWLADGVAFCIFAVTCHRLILIDEEIPTLRNILSKRELKFLIWAAIIYIILILINAIILNIILNFPKITELYKAGDIENYYIRLAVSAPVLYILARLCLIFPGAAIDSKVGIKWSWRNTKQYQFKIFIVIAVYPFIISLILWWLTREDAFLIEQVLTSLLYYIGLALEIIALSLTYSSIINNKEKGVFDA